MIEINDDISIAKAAIKLAHQNERQVWEECPTYDLNNPRYKAWRKRWLHYQTLENLAYKHYQSILSNLGI